MTKKIPLKLLDRSILAVEASRSRLDPWTLFSLVVCPNNKILIPFSRLAMQNHLPQALPSPSSQGDEGGAGLWSRIILFGKIVLQECSPVCSLSLRQGGQSSLPHHRAIHVLPSTFGTL